MGFMRNEYRITPKTHPSRLRHSLRVPIIVLLVLILAESSLAIALVAGNPLDKNPAGSFLPYTEIGFDSPVGDDSLQIINVPAPGTTTVKPPDPPDPNAPRIYLTFDDGPSSESTTKIIDILETYGIKATFFVLGSQAEQLPDMVRLISSKGHTVANHGYSHNYDTIYRSADAFMQDIGKCESILSNILDKPPVRIIRFPAGSAAVELDNNPGIRTSIKQLLQAGGWRYFDWTVSLETQSMMARLSPDTWLHTSLERSRQKYRLVLPTSSSSHTTPIRVRGPLQICRRSSNTARLRVMRLKPLRLLLRGVNIGN